MLAEFLGERRANSEAVEYLADLVQLKKSLERGLINPCEKIIDEHWIDVQHSLRRSAVLPFDLKNSPRPVHVVSDVLEFHHLKQINL